jgi:phosphohistidine phosphatase
MKVVLIRPTPAVDPHLAASDASRHLTARGRALARKVGERLKRDGVSFDVIVTSPLVRAVQTAELVAQAAGYDGEIRAVVALAPDGSVRRAVEELEGAGAAVVAVGHEPSISALAAHLGGRSSHPSLRKGQALVFDEGRLVTSIDPDAP